MTINGIIKLINKTQTFNDNGFKKKELVIITNEQYPQIILIEFVQDKIEMLNNSRTGDNVTIFVNLIGREWVNSKGETKYFITLQGWRIEKIVATL